jgi:subtilisin family serine protease
LRLQLGWLVVGIAACCSAAAPVVQSVTPALIGMGGKVRLEGSGFQTSDTAVVVFAPDVVADQWFRHTDTQITEVVPFGAVNGPVTVVTGVPAATLRDLQQQIDRLTGIQSQQYESELAQLEATKTSLLAAGTAGVGPSVSITFGWLNATEPPVIGDAGGSDVLLNRIIVDLADFVSFDVAAQIGSALNAQLVGHVPFSNSYIFDLSSPAGSFTQLQALAAPLFANPQVVDVWFDMVLQPGQTQYADVDWVDRYRQSAIQGRALAWASDRIQAPGAWNLVERFVPARDGLAAGRASVAPVTMAVLDSGIDAGPDGHPEFRGVTIVKVNVQFRQFFGVNVPVGWQEDTYTGSDPAPASGSQHGTGVAALMGAQNGVVIPGAANGDRGINGLLHNPMQYKILMRQVSALMQDTAATTTDLLTTISQARLENAKVLNMSYGNECPTDLAKNPNTALYSAQLYRIYLALNVVGARLMFVPAAMNCGSPTPQQLTRFARTDGQVLAYDPNGAAANNGNHVPASLGTMPGVLAVGALTREDQRTGFSDWGTPVQIAAPGEYVLTAGSNAGTEFGLTALGLNIGTANYQQAVGTSFSAPLVAGSAALLFAVNPKLTPAQVKNYLIQTALPINTTDPTGALLTWPTLKTGFAVRQVMLDAGLIQEGQQWTGVSKLTFGAGPSPFYVYVGEMRRAAADGRSEIFAVRPLAESGNNVITDGPVAVTHDGTLAAWTTSAAALRSYNFATGAFAAIPFSPSGLLEPAGLQFEYTPSAALLFQSVGPSKTGACIKQVNMLTTANGPAGMVLASGQWPTCGVWGIEGITTPPQGTLWALGFWNSSGEDTVYKTFEAMSFTTPATLPVTFGSPIRKLAYSPDGQGRAYFETTGAGTDLVTASLGDFNARSVTLAGFGPRTIFDVQWSPEGSELSYFYQPGIINSIQRDRRNVADRNLQVLYTAPGSAFVRKLSWRW